MGLGITENTAAWGQIKGNIIYQTDLTDYINSFGFLTDAPNDGGVYARKNLTWFQITPPPSSFPSGCEIYYNCDETVGTIAHDSTPNGADATITGSVTLGATGIINTGFEYTGGYLLTPSVSASAYSISGWAYCTNTTLQNDIVGVGGNGQQFVIIGGNYTLWSDFVHLATANQNSWDHFVFSDDGTTMNFYLNGSLAHTGASPGTGISGNLYLAVNQYLNNGYFNGNLDEVGFWYRALTSTEVTQLYNSGAGLPYS